MRCISCVWFDNGECIKLGKRRIRVLCTYYNKLPEIALSYAKSMSETTGIPVDEVIRSEGFKSYLRRFSEVRL